MNYFSTKQHGFIFGRSTVSNLWATDAIIANWCNNNSAFDIFTVEFSRSFNKAPYNLLLNVLGNCNLYRSDLVDWKVS